MKKLTKWQQFKLDKFDTRSKQDYFSMQYELASGLEQYLIHMKTYLPLLKKIPFDSKYQKNPKEYTIINGQRYNNFNEYFRLIIIQQKSIMYRFLHYLKYNWSEVEEFYNWCEFKSEHKVKIIMDEYGEDILFDWGASLKKCKKMVDELYEIDFTTSTHEISLDDTEAIFKILYEGQELFEIVASRLGFLKEGSKKRDIPSLFKNKLAMYCQNASLISYDDLYRKINIHNERFKEDNNYFEDEFYKKLLIGRKYNI